jgi:hypothetical protein
MNDELRAPFPWFGGNAHRERIWFSPNCLTPDVSAVETSA